MHETHRLPASEEGARRVSPLKAQALYARKGSLLWAANGNLCSGHRSDSGTCAILSRPAAGRAKLQDAPPQVARLTLTIPFESYERRH